MKGWEGEKVFALSAACTVHLQVLRSYYACLGSYKSRALLDWETWVSFFFLAKKSLRKYAFYALAISLQGSHS